MPTIPFTPQQRLAIETSGRSVIVSAAAGSGKTAVLAERCAYLLCDAPPGQRCRVDELLVLTFTDAAAGEMRSRIVEAVRARLQALPGDDRLREQVALVDTAQISTIHAFCLWLVRRWFSELGIDPAATLLDADEATLLKREVLDALLTRLYGIAAPSGDPAGALGSPLEDNRDEPSHKNGAEPAGPGDARTQVDEALARAFVKLVDDYGLGDDRNIAALALRLFEFVMSLPDPDGWLGEARESPAKYPERVVLALIAGLRTELDRQIEHCEQTAAALEAGDPIGHFYASQIREYVDHLREWASEAPSIARSEVDRDGAGNVLAQFVSLRERIGSFEFSKKTGPRLGKSTDPAVIAARGAARERLRLIKERLFRDRLRKRFGLFSVDEWLSGLRTTAPYVSTIVEIVLAFREAYAARKRRLDALDFSDLERLAFDLLCSKDDPQEPSEVARSLHRRFAHVLVDEFQDINPIQQAIIRLVSRESDPDQANNLFVVGDVKQSIYRFRLAEPTIFTERLRRFRSSKTEDAAVALQNNFRSRPEILEAVNVLFRRFMREGAGDVVYDEEAELRPGRDVDHDVGPASSRSQRPVEVHLLERSWGHLAGQEDDEAVERGVADLRNPSRWAPIEREAFLIGSRIREWVSAGEFIVAGEPLRYRHVAVLLRAAKINAERMAAMLISMGIPAYTNAGGSLFGALEARDVLAGLQVLDNPQQDIPLAAVLRSGIFGGPLSEDELVQIRCQDRDIPFHEAVREYVDLEGDDDVGDRLRAILGRMNRYREEARRRPLAEVLWSIYERQGYLAYVSGLPNGPQRLANLLKLHELARKFGTFRRQGLHRFLRFVETLEEKDQDIAAAPAIGESDDVVRIMSIHQAKGLEFPVVFLAGLGTKFNLGDRSGSMIFERNAGIALRVVDTDRMIEYPSAAHQRAADEIERTAREEELRILYVVMTRAREKLVLVGSRNNVTKCHGAAPSTGGASTPSLWGITTAVAPLDWLIPALAAAPAGLVRGLGGTTRNKPTFDVHLHEPNDMASWSVEGSADSSQAETLRAVAHGEALPSDEPLAPDNPQVERVLSRMEYVYPQLAVASVRAALGASEVKGVYDFRRDPDEREDSTGYAASRLAGKTCGSPAPSRFEPGSAAHRGIITHRVLQHLDFTVAVDAPGVVSELQRMTTEGLISAEDRAAVDAASIEWFVSTRLAAKIRDACGAYRREFQYIATEPPSYFDPSIGPAPGDKVLVRGIVDGILPAVDGIEIVDFKTDAIDPDEVPERVERYRPQMETYSRAMSRIWRRPVRACCLVFLTARRVVELHDIG